MCMHKPTVDKYLWIILVRSHNTFYIIYLIEVSTCYILNIFYNFSEITVTILFPHTYSTFQQLNLSSTNKCQLNKRKVTRLGFETTTTNDNHASERAS